MTAGFYIYDKFHVAGRPGLAMAATLVLFLLILSITFFQQLIFGRRWGDKDEKKWLRCFSLLFLTILGIITVFPIYLYMILGGLMTYREATSIPPTVLPESFQWVNYFSVFEKRHLSSISSTRHLYH